MASKEEQHRLNENARVSAARTAKRADLKKREMQRSPLYTPKKHTAKLRKFAIDECEGELGP